MSRTGSAGKIDGGLRSEARSGLPLRIGWRWSPMETGSTVLGVPDSFWSHQPTRKSGWCEMKRTHGSVVAMRPHQVGWLMWHHAAGVRCHILVRATGRESSGGAGDSLWLLRGDAAADLADAGLTRCPSHLVLGVWPGSPDMWRWDEVGQLLLA